MEKVKEFVSEHKKEIAYAVGGIILYKIAYGRGWRDYKRTVSNVFSTMRRNGYNVVQLVESEVKK